jgi:tRNA C32,U32 (ribose-2'-O)-methylase TrmJ
LERPRQSRHCDRSYLQADDGLTLDEVHARESQTSLPGDSPYPLVELGHAPPLIGRQILAARTPESRRDQRRQDQELPCAMVLYLKTGDDNYTPYEVQGGP